MLIQIHTKSTFGLKRSIPNMAQKTSKILRFLIAFLVVSILIGCNKSINIDGNFYVQKDSLRQKYILRYKGENIFPNEFVNKVGYNSDWIVANTSSFQENITSSKYYIINKQNYAAQLGETKNLGVMGPFDSINYEETLSELHLQNECKFIISF